MRDPRSLVSHWLEAAGQMAGIGLTVAEDGHCRILLNGGDCCVIEVPRESERVYLYLAVARLSDDPDEANRQLRQALKLNAFGMETGTCSFSYDPRSEHLVLTQAADIDGLDETRFCSLLDEFICSALWAKTRFDEEARSQPRHVPRASSPFDAFVQSRA